MTGKSSGLYPVLIAVSWDNVIPSASLKPGFRINCLNYPGANDCEINAIKLLPYVFFFSVKVSFITDDDEFNRDDELDDEFSAGKKTFSPDTEFSARLSDAEIFKGVSRHSSISVDDEDDESKDPVYFLPSTDPDTDRYARLVCHCQSQWNKCRRKRNRLKQQCVVAMQATL